MRVQTGATRGIRQAKATSDQEPTIRPVQIPEGSRSKLPKVREAPLTRGLLLHRSSCWIEAFEVTETLYLAVIAERSEG
jgi:hypothetical protein